MKQRMNAQVKVSTDLCAASEDLHRSLSTMELHGPDTLPQTTDSEQNRYSSFKVTAECDDVKEMYDPVLWTEGAFVRHFYDVCKNKSGVVPGVNKLNAPSVDDVQ